MVAAAKFTPRPARIRQAIVGGGRPEAACHVLTLADGPHAA